MGVFSKLAFWKKKDDFDLGKDFGADLGLGPMDNNFGMDNGMPQQNNMGLGQNMNLGMQEDIGFGNSGRNNRSAQPPGQPVPIQQPFGGIQQQQMADSSRDKFEVVSAKLDSIRYTLESINQRIANLERIAYGEQDQQPKRRW